MNTSTLAPLPTLFFAAAAFALVRSVAGAAAAVPAPMTLASGLNATRATIPVAINGRRFRCVLDTGSSAILVAPAVARAAKLAAKAATSEVSPDGHTYADRNTQIARFAVAGYTLHDVSALISSNLSGNDVLCGYDFFARVPTLIDRDRRSVTLFPSKAALDRMRCLPIDLLPRVPLATVQINGAWIDHIVLDSGMVGGGALWDGVRPHLVRPLVASDGYVTAPAAVRNGLACGANASVRFFPGAPGSSMAICTEAQRPDGYNGIIETNVSSVRAMGIDYPHHRICLRTSGYGEIVSSRRTPVVDRDAWSRFNRLRPPR